MAAKTLKQRILLRSSSCLLPNLLPRSFRQVVCMSGISFMVDEQGRKTAAIIDLREHEQLWEDIYDSLLVASRANEPGESLESVKRRLTRKPTRNG
jgi:hypothetical protein